MLNIWLDLESSHKSQVMELYVEDKKTLWLHDFQTDFRWEVTVLAIAFPLQ